MGNRYWLKLGLPDCAIAIFILLMGIGRTKKSIPLRLPKIPGHEIVGWIEEIGDYVPEGLLQEGGMVAVFGGWGCVRDMYSL
jgi:D-arabinose 1-dehydrogenase-like Zn-dependent alcohol dehydrogenase